MRVRAGTGLSLLRDGRKAAAEAAERALVAAGIDRAALAFVFATTDHAAHYGEVLSIVGQVTRAPTISGCSGAGVLTQDREIERGPAVAILVVGGEGVEAEAGLLPEAGSHELGQALGVLARLERGGAVSTRPAEAGRGVPSPPPTIVLFPDLRGFEPGEFFKGLEQAVGFLPVVGAAPSGRGGRFYQFGGGKVVEGRTATAIVKKGLTVEVAVAHGNRPIGRACVITKCEGSVIFTLAGRPAMEVLAEALELEGLEESSADETPVFAGIAIDPAKHPLTLGDFLIRPIVGVDETTGAVALSEHVRVGQTVVFQLRDARAAALGLEAALASLKRRLEGRVPAFALYFDCVARGTTLYGEKDHDVRAIRTKFPALPFAGFFGNGELAPVGDRNFLHSHTGVLVAFCETAVPENGDR